MRLSVLLLLALAARAGENLLPNGAFEKEVEGWVFFQFGGEDKREVEGKTKALHVAKASKGGPPAMIWTDYALDPSQEGKLSFSLRAKGKKLGRTEILFILWDDKDGIAIEEKMHDGDLGAKWQTFEKEIEIPGPAKGGRILVRLWEDGELWLDDASVRLKGAAPEPAPKGALAVRNGDFEKSKEGWAPVGGTDELKVALEKGELRLARGGRRLYPEPGVQQIVKAPRAKRVTLRCRARAAGARACVALLAETQDGALVAYARAETAEAKEIELPLALVSSVKQLRIVLAIHGPGEAFFDDVRLE
jgi:hypothetical protein